MNTHVEIARQQMFTQSCEVVKSKLTAMCRQVDDSIATKVDQVFLLMRRDYLTVVSGADMSQGQTMPKWERQMRASVWEAIEDREKGEVQDENSDERETVKEEIANGDTDLYSATAIPVEDLSGAADENSPDLMYDPFATPLNSNH
jgi:hypothetical protein